VIAPSYRCRLSGSVGSPRAGLDQKQEAAVTSYRPLHEGWTLSTDDTVPYGEQAVPATVPGGVHLDLLAAGLIPDPYLDRNELEVAWIARTDWRYRCTFDWAGPVEGENVDLVCDGLDTVATVTVNGVEVARTANMHRQYRFGVTEVLVPGTNTLDIRFDSAYGYAEKLRDEMGPRPNAYPEPFNFIRKMASNFGWDWGPTLVTAGIWRSIGLDTWRTARLDQVRPLVTLDGTDGRVEVHTRLARSGSGPVRLLATVTGHGVDLGTDLLLEPDASETALELTVPQPRLWWPHGLGEPDRYQLQVTLLDPDGTEIDRWERKIGFRSVQLDTSADEHGSAYTVVVNGSPVFVRGVNWIPDDAFVSRVDRARYATRLHQARDANCNYLRVWGGGIYESDDFYDLADELGLMVGQDFLFACAAYPEGEPLRSEIEAEAEQAIVRLAHHPSLLVWTGNNENIWGFADWGWAEKLDGKDWGAGYYFDLLPRLMQDLDPTRPYWPGSPYSGTQDLHPNDAAHGSMHIWEVWNREDYSTYRDYRPRFVGEFGFQAPPVYATLRRAISDEPLTPTSPGMLHHQKADDGNGKLERGLQAHLPTPADFDDWHYLTQVNQARALSLGIEHFRSLRPYCMGAIMWQLNDNWPVTSWAAVDGDGRRKPLWYALRQSFSPRLLTIQPRDGGLALVAVNDSATEWTVPVSVTRYSLGGEPRAKHAVDLTVPAAGAVTVVLPAELTTDGRADELLRATTAGVKGGEAWWFFAEDKDIPYPPARFATSVTELPGAVRLTVTARSILRDVTVFADRLAPAAEVSDALVTLLPGDSFTFTVHTQESLSAEHLSSRPVLRCVNDLAH
jgi:beta-mannosidase